MTAPLNGRAVTGRTIARFVHHWPWYTWTITFGLPLLISGLVLLTGDRLAAMISVVVLPLLASLPITLVLRSFRVNITERAIVEGPFLPGYTRDVHLFTDIDVSTLRSWENVSAYLHSAEIPSLMTVGKINRGARQGVSYRVRRVGDLASGQLTENQLVRDLGGTSEVMSIARGAEPFVRTLAKAMEAAGVAPADEILRTALPPGRLSPERDAHLREIPGYPEPRPQSRIEDLPPELQEKVRRHIID